MIKINAYSKRLIYTSKYGEEQDAKDVPNDFAFFMPERFSEKEELIYTAYGDTREDAEKALDAYIEVSSEKIGRQEVVEV